MAKLVKCKSCGNDVSSSAKVCPKCGAKNSKPIYKRIWVYILALFIIILILPGNNEETNDNSNIVPNNMQKESIEYIKVNIDELEDQLELNAAAAKDMYNNKYLEITGRLSTIDSDLKYISVVSSTDDWDIIGVHCTIKNQDTRNKVKTLTKDQNITVRGKITDVGEVLGYYLDIIEIVD